MAKIMNLDGTQQLDLTRGTVEQAYDRWAPIYDLVFGGVFRIQNVPQDQIHPVLMIECPRLLFPFAREIIATGVRNGGFPPLYIDPVDFVGMYRQKMAEQAGQKPAS